VTQGNEIGGPLPGQRNVISGNNNYGGVWSANGSSGAVIQGNYIGTDVTGMVPLGNSPHGITLRGGGNNLVGGTAPGAGNVISANAQRGIEIAESPASGSVIQGNLIGTDAAGTVAAGNGKSGILIDGGFPDPLYRNIIAANVISGNEVGVTITGATANGNALLSNKIGTDVTGTARIPNLDDGVRIDGAPNTIVGQPGEGNLISGNGTLLSGFVNRHADAIDVSGATASGTSMPHAVVPVCWIVARNVWLMAAVYGAIGTPTVSSAAATSGVRGSASACGDQGKNTSVCPMRRSTNWLSRGYWIAPVPEARYAAKSRPTRSASPLVGSS